MAQDKQDKAMDPEGAIKGGRYLTEDPETDVEGHVVKRGASGVADDPGADADEATRIKATDDSDETVGGPTDPDRGHFSDRNLKLAIVPVAW